MGRRGPPPAPTSVKLRQGITRSDRLNLDEPIPREGELVMPSSLSAGGRNVWRRIARDLPPSMVKPLDRDLFQMYCEAVVRWQRASKAYGESIGVLRGRGGEEWVKNPLHQIVRDNGQEVIRLARELGFSPAARAGLRIGGEGGVAGGIAETIGPAPRLRAVGGRDD